MFNLFKVDSGGGWQTDDGKSYNVVTVSDTSKHPKKDGWCTSLENAVKAASRKAKEPLDESADTV